MAQLPQVKRLVIEDFPGEKSWIQKLFAPLNTFMEGVTQAFNRNLTLRQNLSADIITVTLSSVPTSSAPAALPWSLKSAPVLLMVGAIARQDGTSFTLSGAVQVQWAYGSTGLQLIDLTGITPTSATPYVLTLAAFTG